MVQNSQQNQTPAHTEYRIGCLHYSGHIHQNVTPSASGLFCLPR